MLTDRPVRARFSLRPPRSAAVPARYLSLIHILRKISSNESTQIFVFDEQTGTRRQGIVGADQGFSFAQLVLDDAWLDAFNYTLQGFTVDEDTMGFETIEEVGIGGNFLSEWHTVEYMRSSWWKHDLFPRQTFPEGEPIQTARQRAQERAQTIIAENRTDEPVIDGAQCTICLLYTSRCV